MAFIIADSFERYGGNATDFQLRYSVAGGVPLNTTHPKTGTYSYGNGQAYMNPIGGISPASTRLYFGMWFWWTGTPAYQAMFAPLRYFTTYDGFNLQWDINGTAADKLNFTRSGGAIGLSSGTPLVRSAMNYLEGMVLTHDSAGAYEFRINGVNVLSGSGVQTSAAGTALTGLYLGAQSGYWVDGYWLFDDTGSSCNGFPGEPLIISGHAPNANGAYVEGTPSGVGSHASLMDEQPSNGDTDYVTLTTGQRETVGFDFTDIARKTCFAVQPSAVVKATSAGTNSVAMLTNTGAGLAQGVTQVLGNTSYVSVQQGFGLTGTPGSAEVGVKAVAAVADVRVTQVFVDMLVTEADHASAFNPLNL